MRTLFLLSAALFCSLLCYETAIAAVPVADAGPNQTVAVGSVVQLDAAGSFDADGDPLNYTWTITVMPPGSAAVLSNINAAAPTFLADLVGTYTVRLIANDGTNDSPPDFVTITARLVPVPSLSTWGVIVMTLLIGTISIRRLKNSMV